MTRATFQPTSTSQSTVESQHYSLAPSRGLSQRRNVGLVIMGSGSSLAAFPLATVAWGGRSWQWAWAVGAAVALLCGAVGVVRLSVVDGRASGGRAPQRSPMQAASQPRTGLGLWADRLGPTALAGWAAALGLAGLALSMLLALTGTTSVTWWTASAFLVAVALALALVVIDEMAIKR